MKESKAPSIGRTPAQKFIDKWQGLFYLIPWIIGFVVFKAIPFGQSLYYSFTDMDFFNGIHQYGIMNYVDAFSTPKITKALITTFKYSFITVPLKLVFALFIAYILNFKIACVNLFRTVYYIPSILGGSVAIAVLWKAVFRDDGLVNTLIRILTFGHFQGPSWLSDPSYALWIICFLRIWQFGSAMVLFLAALKGVPADLYEAATIDGAGNWSLRSARLSRSSMARSSSPTAVPAVPPPSSPFWSTTTHSSPTRWAWLPHWHGSCSLSSAS